MISLNKEIVELLKGIPQAKLKYQFPEGKTEMPVITYYEAGNVPYAGADNDEYMSRIDMMVDVWAESAAQAIDLSIQVNDKLKEAGYIRKMAHESKDAKSGLFRKTMRFEKVV